MRYAFGDFELDDTTFELRRAGQPVSLRPQALEVLLHLVRARDRVVTREELLEMVWAGTAVSSTALAQAILAVRRALADDPDEPHVIQTVRARGYRFILPVVEQVELQASAVRADELVGRDEPLATLEGFVRAARDGRGGIALVTGEPGVGKTRLVAALAARAAAAGVLVVGARCHDQPAAPRLWPWIQVLRELARDPAASAQLARHEHLAALVADDPSEGAPAPDAQQQFRVSDQLARLLKDAARARPLLLVLDDMQWADEESLALTKFVAREIGASPVLLVVVYRAAGTSPNAALARTAGALARTDPTRTLVLRGLSRDEVARLATASLGRPLSEHALARVFEKTEGNPLFVTQLLHGMRGGATEGSGSGAAATSAMLSTDVMRDAIALHIGELTPECARVLACAAVLGRTFTVAALSGTSGLEATQLLPLLDEAIGARIVARASSRPGEHRFVHALVRDVLYRRLAVAERVRMHAAAGEAILARTPAPEGEALEAVAAHFAEAAAGGDAERAVTWCLRAAGAAETPEDALEHLERATRAVEHATAPESRATLADRVASARERLGRG